MFCASSLQICFSQTAQKRASDSSFLVSQHHCNHTVSHCQSRSEQRWSSLWARWSFKYSESQSACWWSRSSSDGWWMMTDTDAGSPALATRIQIWGVPQKCLMKYSAAPYFFFYSPNQVFTSFCTPLLCFQSEGLHFCIPRGASQKVGWMSKWQQRAGKKGKWEAGNTCVGTCLQMWGSTCVSLCTCALMWISVCSACNACERTAAAAAAVCRQNAVISLLMCHRGRAALFIQNVMRNNSQHFKSV